MIHIRSAAFASFFVTCFSAYVHILGHSGFEFVEEKNKQNWKKYTKQKANIYAALFANRLDQEMNI